MKARLYLFAAALLFSTGGAAIKAATLTGWQIASLRSLAAAIVLLALLPESRRLGSRTVWLGSIAYAATLVLFALATRMTTAANAIFLQSTAPIYLLAIGPLLLREPVRRRDLLLGGVMCAGMALFFLDSDAATALAPNPALGNLLAALSGFTWAANLAILRALARGKADGAGGDLALPVVAAGNLLAFALAAPMAWPVPVPGPLDLSVIGYLGCFQVGLAYVCLTRGVAGVPALEASVLLLVEPAMNPVWTYFVHGERPGALSIAGAAVLLTATLAQSVTAMPRETPPSPTAEDRNAVTPAATPPAAP